MEKQPLDASIPVIDARSPHPDDRLVGRHVTITGIKASHAASLYEHVGGEEHVDLWYYMRHGPFFSLDAYTANLASKEGSTDPVVYAILLHNKPPHHSATSHEGSNDDNSNDSKAAGGAGHVKRERKADKDGKDDDDDDGTPVGVVALRRIDLANRTVELGHLLFGAPLARSRAGTEALYLVARHALGSGNVGNGGNDGDDDDGLGLRFRRLEWKCDALNAASARAAARLGFVFEGTFRQHKIVRGGRSRDSHWFSIIDAEWPVRRRALEAWLDDANFDDLGRQRRRLEEFRMDEEERAAAAGARDDERVIA